eukprot:3526609-Rhodomonas_salina.1
MGSLAWWCEGAGCSLNPRPGRALTRRSCRSEERKRRKTRRSCRRGDKREQRGANRPFERVQEKQECGAEEEEGYIFATTLDLLSGRT